MGTNMKKLIILVLAITFMLLISSKLFAEEAASAFPEGRVAARGKDANILALDEAKPLDMQATIMGVPGALRPQDTPVGSDCPMCEPGEIDPFNPDGTPVVGPGGSKVKRRQ